MKKDNKVIVLKRNQAVRWHRRMWNWIAEQYKNGSEESVIVLKQKFVEAHNITCLLSNCFCCDYSRNCSLGNYGNKPCYYCRNYCPLDWESCNNRCFTNGYYGELNLLAYEDDFDSNEAYKLAKRIAMLSKRKEGEKTNESDEM